MRLKLFILLLCLSGSVSAQVITSFSGDVTICAGQNASYVVTASPIVGGDVLTYQWQLSLDGGSTFSNLTGATNTTYSLTSVPYSDNGNFYQVVVTETGVFNYTESSYEDDGYTGNLTVNPTPDPITGTASVCSGFTTTLSDATLGGTWSSSNTTVATSGATTGIIYGVSSGTTVITYNASGCTITTSFLVNPVITGTSFIICGTSTTTLSSGFTGGTWASSSAHITVNSTSGLVTGVSTGTSTITYTASGSHCSTTQTLTDNATPVITGTFTISGTGTSALAISPGVTGGGWGIDNTAIATVGSSSGIVTGVSAGTTTVRYTTTGVGCNASQVITVIFGSALVLWFMRP
jgi:hypothetical protein